MTPFIIIILGVHGAGIGWVFFMRPGSAMIEISYPSKGWYFYYATKGYASAHYPDVRVFQLELFMISNDIAGRTVYHHDVWVPPGKLLQFVHDAVSGKPSYYPYKMAQTYKTNNQQNKTQTKACQQNETNVIMDNHGNGTDLGRKVNLCIGTKKTKPRGQWSASEGVD